MQDHARIRQRAHQIWEQSGRPDGQHESHWAQAERELAADGRAPAASEGNDPSVDMPGSDSVGSLEPKSSLQDFEERQKGGAKQ
jgi:hypothetical protein